MLTLLQQLMNFLFQEPILSLLMGGYLLITFGNSKEREKYFERTWKILITPVKILEYESIPSAFSSTQEKMESFFWKPYVEGTLKNLTQSVSATLKMEWKKAAGWLFLDIMLVTFLIADLITIKEIASLLGFPITLEFLEDFDYGFAITMGTFFSIIASGFILLEVTANKKESKASKGDVAENKGEITEYKGSEYTNFSSPFYDRFRSLIKNLAIITIVSSLFVILFFGLRAYSVSATLPDNIANIISNLAQFGGNVLVRFNTFIVTLLIFTESFNGLQSVFIIIILAVIIVLALIYFVTDIFIKAVLLIMDLFYRLFLWIIWTFSFWIAKPIETVFSPAVMLLEKILGKKTTAENTADIES